MLLHEIKASNLLSFGPKSEPLELRPLNVLIGPNGSGKSNLIDIISLLRATPMPGAQESTRDLRGVIRRGGGVHEWIWKGDPNEPASFVAVLSNIDEKQPRLRHSLRFRDDNQAFRLDDEYIENAEPLSNHKEPVFYYRYRQGHPVIRIQKSKNTSRLNAKEFDLDQSILAQRRDPERYPEITYLAKIYERIRIYREWTFGRSSIFRSAQPSDLRSDALEEDFSNIGLFLNHLRGVPRVKNAIINHLRDFYGGLDDFDVRIKGGTVQVFLTEGDFTLPATRLSDGTLRYLCLLAILCNPDPPPLTCIEEPELGLHPDLLPKVADLLVEASKRTQLVVTTHSDILVDAMTEHPEDVVVFEKHDGCTEAKRLDADHLSIWLEKYRLGDLWLRGEIGGTRW
jgi:predicted ATPase